MIPSVSRNQSTVSREPRRHQHAVADALDVRRPPGQPHQFAGARSRRFAGIEPLPFDRDRTHRLDAAHHFDLIAVRLGQPHALAAAGLVDIFHARGARRLGEPLQIVLAVDVIGEPDEFRVALFGDVDVVGGIRAAHIERFVGPVRPAHAEPRQELFRDIEIGRAHAPISDIPRLDPGHFLTPSNGS